MSNSYFTHPNRLTPYSTARAEEVNDIFDSIASGLDQVELDITTEAGLLQASSAADRTATEAAKVAAEAARDAAQGSASSASASASAATAQAGIATTGANTATTQAGIATTGANTATTQAGIATTGANTATTQAGIATTQAETATTQAGIAADAASNALASELKAADWAEKPTEVEPGKYSAKFWADAAQTATGLGSAALADLGHTTGNAVPAGGANGALTIGTNDATSLTLETNNTPRMQIDSSGIITAAFNGDDTDTTSNRLLKIGDFGLGGRGVSHPSADLNLTSNPGFYRLSNADANAYPGKISGDSLIVTSFSTSYVGQIGMSRSGAVWTRYNNNGTWTDWNQVIQADSSGNVLVTGSGGLGYGVGSGGTVVQATSKSTTVTLNKPCGQITMHNAALAAGASVVFTVANNYVAPGDCILLTGNFITVDPTNYRIEITRRAFEQFQIRVTNITAGSRSEELVISFAIIKGAQS